MHFPAHPDQVTAEWLSERLGHEVISVRWEPIGTGQVGDSARFHLDCKSDACPSTLAGKFPAEDAASRDTATRFGLYEKEVRFYRDVAPLLDVRVPSVLAAEVSGDGAEFILLFEDLGPANQGDQISSCEIDQARDAIRQAAAIHGPSWGNEKAIGHDWLVVPPERSALVRALYPQAQTVFGERYRDILEPEFMALCEKLASLAGSYFESDAEPQCVVHGDFRLDNMLFDIRGGAEPIAILDWQTVVAGNPLTDIGYFMGCGIGERLWRDHERELLGLYRDEMAQRGVTFEDDVFDRDYRRGILHGVSTAVFSAAFVERTERGDANFLSMARGACSLALERDSLAALTGES